MKIIKLRNFLKNIPVISYLGSLLLSFLREVNRKYLIIKYPFGKYLSCNSVDVFCNFNNKSFWWYDGYKANLELDQKVIRAILKESEGDVFIDIGAHFGFFSAFLSKELSSKQNEVLLIAIEPDVSNFECLSMTMQKSQNPSVKFIAMNYAISDKNGSQKMFKSQQSCIHSYEEPGAHLHSEINAISLDSLVELHAGNKKVAFIKIDIDGAEPLFFKGGLNVLKNHKPIVFIEFAPTYLAAFGENVKEYFSGLCNQYHVYWVSYQLNEIREVSVLDYEFILRVVGNKVTDMILSSRPLDISNVLKDAS